MVAVERCQGGRDEEIAALTLSIQNDEAGLNLTVADQPDLIDIVQAYARGGFWVALDGDVIVGTIGLLVYGEAGVLRKFFVASRFRGRPGPATALFEAMLERAHTLGLTEIVLDTPRVATRSHAFYARAGFRPAAAEDLPKGYTYPDRDSLLLKLRLAPDEYG